MSFTTGRRRGWRILPLLAAATLVAGCTKRSTEETRHPAEPSCDAPGVREVVECLGQRLKQVSLLAPDSVLVRDIRAAYGPLVAPRLLDAWLAEPRRAPGRDVSSPWPERIEIRSVEPVAPGECRVDGEVVYVTSTESKGEAALRQRVVMKVNGKDGWRVSAYEVVASDSPDSTSAAAAADVIRRYYSAIQALDYRKAYEHWGQNGAASRQTFDEFAAGFKETSRVQVEIGNPSRVEPAAGSRYVRVPVVVRAVTTSGEEQRFEGSYTVRRTVVDGASPEQRRWHIDSAAITRVR